MPKSVIFTVAVILIEWQLGFVILLNLQVPTKQFCIHKGAPKLPNFLKATAIDQINTGFLQEI